MDRLDAMIERVQAIPCRYPEAARNLCLDCWKHALTHGEAAGVAMAADLLVSIPACESYHENLFRPLFPRLADVA